jgi:hypothetical protein
VGKQTFFFVSHFSLSSLSFLLPVAPLFFFSLSPSPNLRLADSPLGLRRCLQRVKRSANFQNHHQLHNSPTMNPFELLGDDDASVEQLSKKVAATTVSKPAAAPAAAAAPKIAGAFRAFRKLLLGELSRA